jgi:hypothetical protein
MLSLMAVDGGLLSVHCMCIPRCDLRGFYFFLFFFIFFFFPVTG